MRIVFVYQMREAPESIRAVAPQHAAYWRDLGLPMYSGGPFADRTGGLITFDADSMEAARSRVDGDPFVRHGLLSEARLKEWVVE